MIGMVKQRISMNREVGTTVDYKKIKKIGIIKQRIYRDRKRKI